MRHGPPVCWQAWPGQRGRVAVTARCVFRACACPARRRRGHLARHQRRPGRPGRLPEHRRQRRHRDAKPAFPLHLATGKELGSKAARAVDAGSTSASAERHLRIDAPGVPGDGSRSRIQVTSASARTARNDLEIGLPGQTGSWPSRSGREQAPRRIKLFTWQDNNASPSSTTSVTDGNGLHIKTHNVNADGTTRCSSAGAATSDNTTPRREAGSRGRRGTVVDLLVNGRLRSNNNDGALWSPRTLRRRAGHEQDRLLQQHACGWPC